jgi:hypothetical protein
VQKAAGSPRVSRNPARIETRDHASSARRGGILWAFFPFVFPPTSKMTLLLTERHSDPHTFPRLPAPVCPSPGRFWRAREPDDLAPPRSPSPRRTAASGPPSSSPAGAVMDVLDDRRLRHHPRRPTFTAATLAATSPLILKPLRTNLAHAAGIPLVASEFGFLSVEGYSSTRP